MTQVVIYGIGSPILVDVEESLFRAGVSVIAGIRNHTGESFLSKEILVMTPDALSEEIPDLPFVVPLFTPGNRQIAAMEAKRMGFSRPYCLIDSSVAVPRSLKMEPGGYINAGCSLGAHSHFGYFVFINRGASIGHHARFGKFVSIGPGAVVAGEVTVGRGAMIGAGAVVLPEVTIAENSVVGAGAVVTRDVPAHCMVLGNPARIVKENIAGYKGITVSMSEY